MYTPGTAFWITPFGLENPGGSAVTVVAFTTTTSIAAVAPTVTAVATVCSVPEIVSAVARPLSPRSVDALPP